MKKEISTESIHEHIYWLRGCKVMLDRDLALLYGVETKVLLQAVKRNLDRFPDDFMFQLEWEEAKVLKSQTVILEGVTNSRSQFVTLKSGETEEEKVPRSQFVILEHGKNVKYRPYAFTEQGIAMLSSVLRSKQAVQVNIAIMRVFVKLRGILASHKELTGKLDDLERKFSKHDQEIQNIFHVIRELMSPPVTPKRKIGFH